MRVSAAQAILPMICPYCNKQWTAAFETTIIEWLDGSTEMKTPDQLECPNCRKFVNIEDEGDW